MDNAPSYVVVGRGRWGQRIGTILDRLGRRVVTFPGTPRRSAAEDDTRYESRIADILGQVGASVAWVSVPPGAHVAALVGGALRAGLHVVVEKPWTADATVTRDLAARAREAGCVVGVHFEYCMLDEVQAWRTRYAGRTGLDFGGRFVSPGPDRLNVPPAVNLGCHLLAIHRYAVPDAAVAELVCAYEAPAQRMVWVQPAKGARDVVDFRNNDQPIVERYIAVFEEHVERAAATDRFPFDLEFARGVSDETRGRLGRQTKP